MSAYFDTMRQNQYATFHWFPIAQRLSEIDELIDRGVHNSNDPKPQWPVLFLIRAHSAWRAAVAMAMVGGAHEAMPLLRSAIEQAAYGVHIGSNEDRFKVWMNRHDGDKAKKVMVEEFKLWRMKKSIGELAPKLLEDFESLYETTIDHGAHPNALGFFTNLTMQNGDGERTISPIYLHDTGKAKDLTLLVSRRVGMWMLSLYLVVYQTRWELLGIRADLERFREEHKGQNPLTPYPASNEHGGH